MNIAETIKQVREARGMTQEDLAERLEVSRQAVSKWEVGASIPTPENLEILSEILEVSFETEEPAPSPSSVTKTVRLWKIAALTLGGLMLAALFSIALFLSMPEESPADPMNAGPAVTGIWFFDEDGTPLDPDLGDGWKRFTVGRRVYLLAGFQNGTENDVFGVSLFATPTGTETYDEREQLAVQAVCDRSFVLFPLEFPEETMLHLDVTLECGGGLNITQTLNVTAVPEEVTGETPVDLSVFPANE